MIHAPKRGNPLFRPKVHSGFDKAWRNNGFDRKIMKRIEDIFKTKEVDKHTVRFLITGTPPPPRLTFKPVWIVLTAGSWLLC